MKKIKVKIMQKKEKSSYHNSSGGSEILRDVKLTAEIVKNRHEAPTSRVGAATSVSNGYLYFFGGQGALNINDLWRLNLSSSIMRKNAMEQTG